MACAPNPEFKLYEGRGLNIAVIGEIPEVKENQISFEKVEFDYLLKEDIKNYIQEFSQR